MTLFFSNINHNLIETMNKKNILEIIHFIEIEFQKYGIDYISQESYEMLYYYTFLHNN